MNDVPGDSIDSSRLTLLVVGNPLFNLGCVLHLDDMDASFWRLSSEGQSSLNLRRHVKQFVSSLAYNEDFWVEFGGDKVLFELYNIFDGHISYWRQRPAGGNVLKDLESTLDAFDRINTVESREAFDLAYECLPSLYLVFKKWSQFLTVKQVPDILDRLDALFSRSLVLLGKRWMDLDDDLGVPYRIPLASRVSFSIRLFAISWVSGLAHGLSVKSSVFVDFLRIPRLLGARWHNVPATLKAAFGLTVLTETLCLFGTGPVKTRFGYSYNVLSLIRSAIWEANQLYSSAPANMFTLAFEDVLAKLDEALNTEWLHTELTSKSLSKLDRLLILRLAERVGTYQGVVSVDRIYEYLDQFPTLTMARSMLNMLSHIKFYRLSDLHELIIAALSDPTFSSQMKQLIAIPMGEIAGSTALLNYLVEHTAGNRIRFFSSPNEIVDQPVHSGNVLFVFDDCALSGTQAIHTFQEWGGERKMDAHHKVHCRAVRNPAAFKQTSIRIILAMATNEAKVRIEQELRALGYADSLVFCGRVECLEDKPFTPSMNYIWPDRSERDELRQFLTSVGCQILRPRAERKQWTQAQLEASALGYSDMQRLLVFQYNVPKSTVSALWERGPMEIGGRSREWLPLFPGAD